MSNESNQDGKGFRIPGILHPVTEFDMSHDIAPEQLAGIPVGGFVRNEVLHEVVEFDFSEAESKAKPDVDFFRAWREESRRLLLPSANGPARPVRTRGGFELFSELMVGLLLGHTVLEALKHSGPRLLCWVWNKITGKEEVDPAKIQLQNDDMVVQVIANVEYLAEKIEMMDDILQAEFRQMRTQLCHPTEEMEKKIIARLVELGWTEPKARRGVRAVSQAASKKAGNS